MNTILCGMPMCGKTTIGKMLAKELGCLFTDTDRLIENAYIANTGKELTCRQIYQIEGESFFRNLEKKELNSLKFLENSIISIGGGCLSDSSNAALLKSIGSLIYLKTPIEILWERVQWKGIPAYLEQNDPKKAFEKIANNRASIYEAIADVIIETENLSKEEIASAILNRF